jgi:hypothetical protein
MAVNLNRTISWVWYCVDTHLRNSCRSSGCKWRQEVAEYAKENPSDWLRLISKERHISYSRGATKHLAEGRGSRKK